MIYEDEDNSQKPSHVSYKEYKKRLNSNPKEGLILFVTSFFALVILFLGIAKQLSPDVDVSIADNNDEVNIEDENSAKVDDRLKILQMEDNNYNQDDETFSPELEEKVQLPKNKSKNISEQDKEAEVIVLGDNKTITPPKEVKPAEPTKPQETQPTQSVSAKVIVGYYATQEQAEVAKDIIKDTGLNIQPFVKNIGGAYTLQVGSFNSKEKAQNAANDLLKHNFPARVIIE